MFTEKIFIEDNEFKSLSMFTDKIFIEDNKIIEND